MKAQTTADDQEIKRLSDGWLALIIGFGWLSLTWLAGRGYSSKGNTEFGIVGIFITTIVGFILFSAIGIYRIRTDRDAGKSSDETVLPVREISAKEGSKENEDLK